MAFQLSNVEPVLVECKPENGYLPKLEDIEDALSKNNKIKMIVVCNPCNPTGAVYTKELLDSIS
jgi:aspartate/methionine/tyrosine aminotransferase